MGKNTHAPEKKRQKKDKGERMQAASQPPSSQNAFEALDIQEEGDEGIDDDEGDGKQKGMIGFFFYH